MRVTAEVTPPVGPARRAAPPSPAMDPFDRMLLSADGTVTTLLEACTGAGRYQDHAAGGPRDA